MQTITASTPLPLTGAKNVRDLGGYPTKDGFTARGVFLRADGLHNLTQKDIRYLTDYGLRLVVDLRGSLEVSRSPDPFGAGHPIEYRSVPMLDQMNSSGFQGALPASLGELYISLLEDSGPEIGRVMALLGGLDQGAALFHCTAGKDRTGVIAMLLLALAGVADEVIVADYRVTDTYMAPVFAAQQAAMAAAGFEIPEFMLRSGPENMELALAHLHTRWGTAEAYLREQAGCGEVLLSRLKEKLGGHGKACQDRN